MQCTMNTMQYNSSQENEYSKIDIAALSEKYPNSRAVFLLNEAQLDYIRDENKAFTYVKRHVVIAILNKRGYEYANVILPFDAETRITKIKARTILQNGQSIMLDHKDIYHANLFPEYIFYSDIHAKRFTMPGVEPGCIIEYQWEQRRSGFNLMTRWEFQKEDPVLCSRYSLTTDLRTPVKTKLYGIKALSDVQQEKMIKGRKQIQWELKNIPALNTEISMANGYHEIPSIMFSPAKFEIWEDVNDWYWLLFVEQIQISKTMRSLLDGLIDSDDSDMDKLSKIFNYVQQNIRYVAIEIGMGGYQPNQSDKIFSNRYGDCKDMSLLIAALAKAENIIVSPVLISNYMHGPTDTSLVSHAHFNHVIAYAKLEDGTDVWMDPTEKNVAFGQLPWYDQDRFAFIVDADQGKIVKTPAAKAKENISLRHWVMEVGSNGIAEGNVQIQLKGALSSEMRTQLQNVNPANIESWLSRDLIDAFPITRIVHLTINGLDEPENPLSMRFDFTTDAIDIQNENYFALQPGLFSGFNLHKVFYKNERSFNVALKYPIMIYDYIKISYPENWIAISGISSDSLNSDFGSYRYQMDVNQAGVAFYRRTFNLDETHIPVSQYADFRTFLYQIFQMDRNLVLYREY